MSTKQNEAVPAQQSGQSSRGIFSILVVLLLMVIIGLQLWYMLDIKKQLDSIQGEYDSLQSILNGSASSSDEGISTESTTDDAAGDAEQSQVTSAEATSTNNATDKQAEASTDSDPASSAAGSISGSMPGDARKYDTPQSQPSLRQPPGQSRQRNINPYYPPFRAYPEPYSAPHPRTYPGPNWDPYEDIRRMHQEMREEMERAFDDLRYGYPYAPQGSTRQQHQDFEYQFRENFSSPRMRVQEDDKQYMISVNIPGADENDVSVRLEGQQLTITGKQKSQQQQSAPDGRFTFSHSRTGKFQRSITLREPVDERGMQTRVENGVLMIRIPKQVL